MSMIKVTLVQRWNEYQPGDKPTVTRGQAEILLARGLAIVPRKKFQRKPAHQTK